MYESTLLYLSKLIRIKKIKLLFVSLSEFCAMFFSDVCIKEEKQFPEVFLIVMDPGLPENRALDLGSAME